MEEQTNNATTTQKSFPMGLMAIVLIVVLGIGIFVYQARSKSQNAPTETQTQQTAQGGTITETKMVAESSEFKDGKYEAVGNYTIPNDKEKIKVIVTLEKGTVADVSVEKMATKPVSMEYQDKFISAYKAMVVGKKISEVKLDKVAGSSLTPQGFNNAIEQIIQQAQS